MRNKPPNSPLKNGDWLAAGVPNPAENDARSVPVPIFQQAARRPAAGPGFTLIELLVVVAIIAVLASILLPSLKGAREQARSVVCGQRLRDLGNGLQTYFTEHKDWIPGYNTSGVSIRAREGVSDWWKTPKLPVQSSDWMTPILSANIEMKTLRADRFTELINKFRCPSQKFYKAVLYEDSRGKNPDWNDFVNQREPWTALSYLMPVHFQYWGTDYGQQRKSEIVLGYNLANERQKLYALTADPGWEATHATYKSVLGQVGNASTKIAAADATRYLTDSGLLDFDPSPNPLYGSFASGGGWWGGDTSYGVRQGTKNYNGRSIGRGSAGNGANLELTYRHGPTRGHASGAGPDNRGTINALFFDASVRKLSDRQSRNPALWYPRGTKVNDAGNVMLDDLSTKEGENLVP